MEFLSEDLYGGQQVSIQDAVDAINRFDINSIQNLQQDLDQLQFLNPSLFQSPASSIDFGMLTSGLPITPEAILGEQASRGLMDTLQTLNSPEFQALYDDLIASDVITDPEQIQDILDPPQFAVGPGFDDQDVFKDPAEIDPSEQIGPTEELGAEDSPFDIIMRSIVGQIGDPSNLDPETVRAINSAVEGYNSSQLQQVGQEIVDAGGFDQWLASQEQEEGTTISDVVEGATEAVTEGVSSAVQDAIDAARDALPDDASVESILDWIAENVPTITPQSIFDEYIGAGVGVNLPTGAPIGSGTVFIPGIPGLPSSSPNMVIGTVDEVMGDILEGNLPGVIGDIAEDPVGGIGAAIEGAVDDAEEVTLGDLLGSDVDLGIGDDEVSDIFTEEGQTTDYGGGLNNGETEDILAGVGGATAAAAAGTGVQRPSGDFTPFMRRLQYTPVAIPKAVVPSAPIVSSLFSEYLK